jgi:23S rRNA (guanosine2251-2'-O)-methyltransferase
VGPQERTERRRRATPADRWYGGLHAVESALEAGRLCEIWVDARRRDPRVRRLVERAESLGVTLHRVLTVALDELLPDVRHQGVIGWGEGPRAGDESVLWDLLRGLEEPPLLLALDRVQDPRNLGACLRSAAAAGAHAVISPRDRSAGMTPAVYKVASGAAEEVPFVQVTNLARVLGALREEGVWVVGAGADAPSSLYQADLRGAVVLALGGEHKGLRRLTRTQCDLLVHIPMRGRVESLNVSAAATVCLFEARRQRDLRSEE